MRTAVVTLVHGRHGHLRRQYAGLADGSRRPDRHVVVAMADPAAAGVPGRQAASRMIDVPVPETGLPLAAARNAGAAAALADGADLLAFLDVDCIPGQELLARYVSAAAQHPGALLCGPVHYLPPPPPGGYTGADLAASVPHAARPAPPDGVCEGGLDHRLFWSLSFAVTAETWCALGGFCERYLGYGGEDTDVGESAAARGIGLVWVGGAVAHHQYHPVSRPPVEHRDDILRNAAIFHERWGWWPMQGWLTAFAERGLARVENGRWVPA